MQLLKWAPSQCWERSPLVEAVLAQCPCSDGFAFPLQWLHISNWNFQVFHEVGGFTSCYGRQGTGSPSRNHKTARPQFCPTSVGYICAHFVRIHQEIEGKAFCFAPASIKKYFPSSKTAQRKCCQAQSLQSSRKEKVRWVSWGSLALACPDICNTEKAEILLISLVLFWLFSILRTCFNDKTMMMLFFCCA